MAPLLDYFDEEKLKEAHRIEQAYEKGEIDFDLAHAQMKAHVGRLTAAELACMEQSFQEKSDDECFREKLQERLALYEGVLVEESAWADLPKNHPLRFYYEENQEMRKHLDELYRLAYKPYIKNQYDECIENLLQWKIHLSRKQNQLYSALEHKGFTRPSETMWLFDNLIRDQLNELQTKAREDLNQDKNKKEFQSLVENFDENIRDLIDKEETILYPTSMRLLNQKDFEHMAQGDGEIGYCFLKGPQELYRDTDLIDGENSDFSSTFSPSETKLHVSEGKLTLEQINLIYKHLPVDLAYVDENELVAFYSDTKHRVFPRSKGVIGRDVKNCHPANSVAIVEEIIDKFRKGEQDRAEFWIQKEPLFIYILYQAVRDSDGKFRGVLEMMQECSHIRSLKGSRTLLTWSDEREEAQKHSEASEELKLQEEKKMEGSDEAELSARLEQKLKVSGPQQKLLDVFVQYPGFQDFLIQENPVFEMMRSPLFRVVQHVATLERAGERSGLGYIGMLQLLEKFIENKEV